MKSRILTAVAFVLLFTMGSMAQTAAKSNPQELKIKTSAQCGMCKDRLEGALAYEKGVNKSVLNITDKVLTVTYNPKKTNPDKIRKVVSNAGYDADDVLADKAAYDALPACCKKKSSTGGCKPGCGGH